jgi:phosphoglycerate kinase
MAYTFFKGDGVQTGKSLVEADRIEDAKKIRAAARNKLHLPLDSVVAAELRPDAKADVVTGAIPAGKAGYDIGPKTIDAYGSIIAGAKTIVWNGPMGVFETPPFHEGTLAIAHALADATKSGAISIVGGGDSAAAVEAAGLAEQMTHVSTGGGASLEFLEGRPFKAIEVLDEA